MGSTLEKVVWMLERIEKDLSGIGPGLTEVRREGRSSYGRATVK